MVQHDRMRTEDKDMITVLKNKQYTTGKNIIEIACESTDTKPTADIATGSLALEVDTGDIYAFSEKTTAWNKVNG